MMASTCSKANETAQQTKVFPTKADNPSVLLRIHTVGSVFHKVLSHFHMCKMAHTQNKEIQFKKTFKIILQWQIKVFHSLEYLHFINNNIYHQAFSSMGQGPNHFQRKCQRTEFE